MKKLWQKNDSLHPLIASFTVGNDWQLDNHLLPFDCLASIAHAEMLRSVAVLTSEECETLKKALQLFLTEHESGHFRVTAEYEDCHTVIENRLASECGEIGKKIHSGRSRNDQVFCALLLYGRHQLFSIVNAAATAASSLLHLAEREERTPMMGRTHLQNAMPSTVAVWAAAYAEQLLTLAAPLDALYRVTNRSPLGSAAGYGVPLPLDRHYTARLLAFDEPHQVVLAAANSRGHWEAYYLDMLGQIMMVLSRFANDLMLFTLPEVGYMRLPSNLCTGSSIMPHKRNPDVLELIRAKAATVIGLSAQVKQIMHALPAGYNRDLQEVKPLLITGIETTQAALTVSNLITESLEIDGDRLAKSIDPQIYSVDYALRLVKEKGISFRDAYHQAASQLQDTAGTEMDSNEVENYASLIAARSSWGAPGNLQLPLLKDRVNEWQEVWTKRNQHVKAVVSQLTE